MATKSTKTTSTAVAVKKPSGGAVMSIQDQLAKLAEGASETVAPATGNVIRLGSDKRFVLPDGSKVDSLDAIVITHSSTNRYYDTDFDRNNPTPPACFAIGANPRTLVPSDNSPLKQSDECSKCPMNQYETAKQGRGKACRNMRALAVVPADEVDGEINLLLVPPSSIRKYDSFVSQLASTVKMPTLAVSVKISMDEDSEFQSLTFEEPKPHDKVNEVLARLDEAKAIVMAEPDVSSFDANRNKRAAPGKTPRRR